VSGDEAADAAKTLAVEKKSAKEPYISAKKPHISTKGP